MENIEHDTKEDTTLGRKSSGVMEPTTVEIRAQSISHLDAFDPDYQDAQKPVKAKLFVNDPFGINKSLLFSNPDLEDVDIDVIRQNESKLMEEEYKPKAWCVSKLTPIKESGTLKEEIVALPETLNIKDNKVCVDLKTHDGKTTALEVSFFNGGIVRLYCLNPVKPSKFCFEMIEKPANLTAYAVGDKVTKDEGQVQVNMAEDQIKVQIKFNPFTVIVLSTKTKTEEPLFEVNPNQSIKFDNNITGNFRFHSPYVYGIPEHAENLLLGNTKTSLPYRLYNNDLFGYPTGSRQALYGSIPMMVSRKADSSTYMTLYWQNTSETFIDVHRTEKTSDTFWISERGNFDCYIFVNHSTKSHFESIANLTGKAAMPQYFSLGYHQCRYSYNDEQDLLHVNEKFNEHEIPCDTLTLDIDHTNGFRYFTWDREMFPDPVFMQDILAKDGRKLVTICDPHIKASEDYHVYNGVVERGIAVQTSDGMPFVGVCFPGDCVWVDFLNEDGREFWASCYSYENYKLSTPVLFAWNDMNEPSVFEKRDKAMPRDNLHTIKPLGHPEKEFQVEHREVHNIYGYCMHKGTYNGLLRRNKDQNIRPHVLSRAFYVGSQKWSTIWTGDTISSWEHLQTTVPMMLAMAICGMSFIGGDVGGFLGNPEPELNVRWTQLGSYMPYFRAHCDKRYDRREPWLNTSEYYHIIKETIKEKYKFLSYWYTCFEDYCRTGIPVIRPVWMDDQAVLDEKLMGDQVRFFVGDGLLVVPILQAGVKSLKGPVDGFKGRWYEYYEKTEVHPHDEVKTGLDRIGVFVKGGHIIPQFEVKSNMKSSKHVKDANIFLFVGLDENETAEGIMYFDDGETFDYKKGLATTKRFSFKNDTLTWEDTGSSGYAPVNKVARVKLMGHKKKFTNAHVVRGEGINEEATLTHVEGYIRAEFSVPAKENWKLVFSLEM